MTHLSSAPTALGSFLGVAHSSPSDVRLSYASIPVTIASVCSESLNSSSSSSLSSSPPSSLESTTRDQLLPCVCKRTSGIVDGGEDRPEDGCEVNYISGLGNVTSGREERCDLGSQNKRAGEGRLGLVDKKRS